MANTKYTLKYKIEYWFQNNDDYDFAIEECEGNNIEDIMAYCQDQRGHYVKPSNIKILEVSEINPLDEMFDSPMKQLDDIFESFATIFAPKPFNKDRNNNYKKAQDEQN
jgi:hypothetical protein